MISRLVLQSLSKDKLSVFLFHKVPQRCDQMVPVDVDMARFEHLLDYTFSQLRVLPLEEAVSRLHSGHLPRRAACITFDDGYPDWLTGVAPALRRRNLHATFFITSGQFDGVPLWHERILAAVRRLQGPLLDLGIPFLPAQSVASLDDRRRQVQRLEQELKYLTLNRREQILRQLEAVAGVRAADVPVMSEAQLRDLHSQGFGIGAHTALHPILDYCNAEEAVREIGGARERLQTIVGGSVNGFAYPNGRPYADFSRLHVDAVKRAGYRYAVTTHWGVADVCTSPFQIPRFTPWAEHDWHVTYQLVRNLMTEPTQVPEVAV
ncbi:polysaccharide deacetylase family protein [Alicycliphilus denitrificans]|uniref:polysaccharide deacetylase family protein n=1 Tax=Alicycliphilus denitrificans TaxID=179636 RepID=UPI0001D9F69D|nr:polysaccharide deacetylase family protein [Alicycliphilus denitrificans]ADU98518.1 polysaccharide deacetylase [Alicycliphilus denitrificans BC]